MTTANPKPMLALQPSAIWHQFQTLCDTPRPSYHEANIRQRLIDWSTDLGLVNYVDPCGNLLIKKPATKNMQGRATIALQGHLDMVPQKTSDSSHDFVNDPIRTQIKDGWVSAIDTTLGADNGIGVAAALAVLESTDIEHGPIEAIFTIEEETSLRGASELETGILQAKILLNLDSEDRGDVYIGCAGGVDINGSKQYTTIDSPYRHHYQVTVAGCRGGHSGLDIHKGFASANVLLARLLATLQQHCQFSLHQLQGGTLRNAIAREAFACLSMDKDDQSALQKHLDDCLRTFQAEFTGVDDLFTITLTSIKETTTSALSPIDQQQVINLINALPHGVASLSRELVGVTDTSINFGVIQLKDGLMDICLLARSLHDSKTTAMADKAVACFELAQVQVSLDNDYPGWIPQPNTGLLKEFLSIHQQEMGFAAQVKVIHAGLECGIIGAKYPGMEMVSFGPNIRGAHSPDERLEIDSVADFWRLLVKLLANL